MFLLKNFNRLLGWVLLMVMVTPGSGQNSEPKGFSLKEAQEFAVKNSYSTRNAQIDLELARKKIWETTAIGLPQINASVQYQDMLDVPTTLLPDFITPAVYQINERMFGISPTEPLPSTQYFPAKFGTQHNLTLGGTLSQLIFNGQYIVGLQASKTFYRASDQSREKTEIEIRQTVANTYILLAVTRENRIILQEGVTLLERTLYETREMFTNGFVEDINVDQMQLNLTNLKNSISALDRQIDLTDKLLKFQMGLDINSGIILKDSLKGLLTLVKLEPILQSGLKLENHIDYRLTETQEKLQWLNLRREQSNYLPVLTGFYTYQKRGMSDQFNFFEKNGNWYPTSIIGINLDIPVFSSFMKQSKVKQARLGLEKMKNTKEQVAQGLVLEAEQSRTIFNNALEKFNRETENLKLANNIYKKTVKKFKEGISSSLELTQAYNQYLSTESNYFTALFELLSAKNRYDKAINNF